MRIALVVPSLQQGGGVPATARFIKDAAQRDGRITLDVVSLSTSSRDPASVRVTSPRSWLRGVRIQSGLWEDLPCAHVGAMCGEIEFMRYRRRPQLTALLSDCDMIQVVGGCPAWANAVTGLGKPVALAVATRARVERRHQDIGSHGLSGRWRRSMTAITGRLDDKALLAVDAIQVMNPSMLEYARTLNAGRNVDLQYAPPGVDAALFHPLAERNPERDPYILCVGRMADPRKRIELLLDAYAQLARPLRDNVRLVLAGASMPTRDFWQRADALGVRDRITWVERPDVAALVRLYQGASVFALPSDEEGFGVVVIEAMACSVPVISTRSGGPEAIISDGDNGFLVPRDDAEAMTGRLRTLLEDSATNVRMGIRARQAIEGRHDEHTAGQIFVDMWTRLVHKART